MAKKRGKAKQKTSKAKAKPRKAKPSSSKKKKSSKSKSPKTRSKVLKIIRPGKIEESIMKAPHEIEEEFFVPSPIHRGKYKIPLGIRFLIGYLIFLSVLYLVSFIYGITFPTTILFGKMIEGARAMIINGVLLALILAMIYGFWKRKAYTFDLSVGFFGFTALNAIISVLLFDSAEHPIFAQMLLLSFISLVFMNTVIIWYVLHERKFFYAKEFHERPFHHRDRVFLYIIISFWVLVLLIGGTMGIQFYKDTTALIDDNLKDLRADPYLGQFVCESKQGADRDVCTLVLATALSEQGRAQEDLVALCNHIDSDFYQFTCMRSIS